MTKSVVAERYGGPEVLALRDVGPPPPGPADVVIAAATEVGHKPANLMFEEPRSPASTEARPSATRPSAPLSAGRARARQSRTGALAWRP